MVFRKKGLISQNRGSHHSTTSQPQESGLRFTRFVLSYSYGSLPEHQSRLPTPHSPFCSPSSPRFFISVVQVPPCGGLSGLRNQVETVKLRDEGNCTLSVTSDIMTVTILPLRTPSTLRSSESVPSTSSVAETLCRFYFL